MAIEIVDFPINNGHFHGCSAAAVQVQVDCDVCRACTIQVWSAGGTEDVRGCNRPGKHTAIEIVDLAMKNGDVP